MPYIIGITGSIASGKTHLLKCFARERGVVCISSDKIVHRLYVENKFLREKIAEVYPEAISENKIDRKKLGEIVFKNPVLKKQLENIVYPVLAEDRDRFIKLLTRQNRKILVIEIPLLFENKLQDICNFTISVSCAKFLKMQRAKRRGNMTLEKFNSVIKTQMPDFKKLKLADISLNSGNQFSQMQGFVKAIIVEVERGL